MRSLQTIALSFGVAIAGAAAANAEGQKSPLSLLKDGYQVRGTSFVPLAEIKLQRPNAVEGIVLVTLQKDDSFAVCEVNWSNWSSLAKASIENDVLCDVR